jgi:hypothetical protein
MELYKVFLTNGSDCYVTGDDESEARDKVKEWLRERYLMAVQIADMELIADTESKGFVDKLIL